MGYRDLLSAIFGREPEEVSEPTKSRDIKSIEKILATLPEREAYVMRSRFGIPMTREEVGRHAGTDGEGGVTKERIRQIEAKALRKLRHPSRSLQLRRYIEA